MLKKIGIILIIFVCIITLFACKDDKTKPKGELTSSYDIRATLDVQNQAVYATTKVTLFNDTDSDLSSLAFYLYPNAHSDCRVDIGGVKCDGADLDFCLDGANLTVTLGTPLKSGESGIYIIGTRVGVPNGNDRFALTAEGVYNLHAFFPRLAYYDGGFVIVPYSDRGDPYLFDESDFTVTLEAPLDYIVAHSGVLLKEDLGESSKLTTIQIDGARDVAFSLSKDFKVSSGESGGVKIAYYGEGEQGQEYVDFISTCIVDLSELIGEYPYESFSVSESDFKHGGMEYSGYTLINKDVRDKKLVLLHELLHQWFGLKVGSNGYAEGWLDESLVSYLSYYYMDIYNNGGYAENIQSIKNSYDKFLSRVRAEIGDSYNPKINLSLSEFRNDEEYAYVVYDYGVLIYHGIAEVVGREKLIKGIKGYYQDMKGKVATESDLIKCLEKHGARKMGGIMRSYLEGKVVG
ncbi:MAG: M1 family metallopeptidase [Clostridia bacterium]|nr:M1 family metallopeptidase [Clostridia bacterium]